MIASLDSFGASRFPLTQGETCAANYDPGQATIIGLLSAAIEACCGDAWRALTASLNNDHFLARSNNPVGSVLTVQPNSQNLTQVKMAWPVLAVYREGEPTSGFYSIDYNNSTQRWSVDWIAGPFSPDTQRKIGALWVPISNAIRAAIVEGMHPAYQNGAYQFHGQFSEIRWITSAGPAVTQELTTDKGQGYYGGSVILETVERMTFQSDAAAAITDFDGGAYLTPHDGYGTPATGADVTVNYDNKK
jgi:hypothetical protein